MRRKILLDRRPRVKVLGVLPNSVVAPTSPRRVWSERQERKPNLLRQRRHTDRQQTCNHAS